MTGKTGAMGATGVAGAKGAKGLVGAAGAAGVAGGRAGATKATEVAGRKGANTTGTAGTTGAAGTTPSNGSYRCSGGYRSDRSDSLRYSRSDRDGPGRRLSRLLPATPRVYPPARACNRCELDPFARNWGATGATGTVLADACLDYCLRLLAYTGPRELATVAFWEPFARNWGATWERQMQQERLGRS